MGHPCRERSFFSESFGYLIRVISPKEGDSRVMSLTIHDDKRHNVGEVGQVLLGDSEASNHWETFF